MSLAETFSNSGADLIHILLIGVVDPPKVQQGGKGSLAALSYV